MGNHTCGPCLRPPSPRGATRICADGTPGSRRRGSNALHGSEDSGPPPPTRLPEHIGRQNQSRHPCPAPGRIFTCQRTQPKPPSAAPWPPGCQAPLANILTYTKHFSPLQEQKRWPTMKCDGMLEGVAPATPVAEATPPQCQRCARPANPNRQPPSYNQ